MIHDRCKGAIRTPPNVWAIAHMLLLQFAGGPVPDVVADVLLVDQDLVNGAARPRPPKVGENPTLIETGGDFPLDLAILNEASVNPPDCLDFLVGTGDKYDAVGLE